MLEAACLEGLAGAHGPAMAARLLGAAESLRERAGAAWPAFVQADSERSADRARRALGDERFAAEWAGGRAMGASEIVGLARPSPPEHPAGLTLREVEVLRLIAAGLTDAQVADTAGAQRSHRPLARALDLSQARRELPHGGHRLRLPAGPGLGEDYLASGHAIR